MATNNKPVEKDAEASIESAISRSEAFIQKNGKVLLGVLIAVVVVVGGYFGYQHLYKLPRAQEASTAMYKAQDAFVLDSFNLALHGNADFLGFEQIMTEFDGTPQANIAYHYAGICYLRQGEFQKAIDNFSEFKSVEGSTGQIITAQNYGLTADAYVELGDMQKGVSFYEKAAASSDNLDTTPTYLRKAALVNYSLGNIDKALEQLQTIKYNYPRSMEARDADKYIALIGQK